MPTVSRSFKATMLLILGLIAGTAPAQARSSSPAVGKGTFGLGINFPGLGLKYFLSDRYALELKGQFQNDAQVGGLRTYRYFRADSRMLLFLGVEGDIVRFKGRTSKGSGAAAEVFFGAEFFTSARFALQVDAGPAYLYLKDQDRSLSATGLEYVMNVGINYYFGKDRGRSERANRKRWSRNDWRYLGGL